MMISPGRLIFWISPDTLFHDHRDGLSKALFSADLGNPQLLTRIDEVRILDDFFVRFEYLWILHGIAIVFFSNLGERITGLDRIEIAFPKIF